MRHNDIKTTTQIQHTATCQRVQQHGSSFTSCSNNASNVTEWMTFDLWVIKPFKQISIELQ